MIFVTVGMQLPFDRLLEAVSQWSGTNSEDVLAQVGISQKTYKNIECVNFMTAKEFDSSIKDCSLVVSHAGIGTILGALYWSKPIIIMPRRKELGEHRNDHQLATARRFGEKRGVHVAWSTEELSEKLNNLDAIVKYGVGGSLSDTASLLMINELKTIIGAKRS